MSICLVALVVLLFLDLRMSAAVPAGFVDEFTDTVNKRKFKEAFDMARNDPSFVGRVLTAGMGRLRMAKKLSTLARATASSRNFLPSSSATKSRVMSSDVGPSPPVASTKSARDNASRTAC